MFVGPMFSGKTTRLYAEIERMRLALIDCVLVRHRCDTRYLGEDAADTAPPSHSGLRIETEAPTPSLGGLRITVASSLAEVKLHPGERAIGIDEGQFYEDLSAAVSEWMDGGVQVLIAALDGDHGREPFAPVSLTYPLSTSITKLTAVCMCCAPRRRPRLAAYTLRTTVEKSQVLVGGLDHYRAVCFDCYRSLRCKSPSA